MQMQRVAFCPVLADSGLSSENWAFMLDQNLRLKSTGCVVWVVDSCPFSSSPSTYSKAGAGLSRVLRELFLNRPPAREDWCRFSAERPVPSCHKLWHKLWSPLAFSGSLDPLQRCFDSFFFLEILRPLFYYGACGDFHFWREVDFLTFSYCWSPLCPLPHYCYHLEESW